MPPLLTLVFVKNAFKHGISYRSHSYVAVSMTLSGGELSFSCISSRHTGSNSDDDKGIGLRNISQRLALLYGDAASMTIREAETDYIVNMDNAEMIERSRISMDAGVLIPVGDSYKADFQRYLTG